MPTSAAPKAKELGTALPNRIWSRAKAAPPCKTSGASSEASRNRRKVAGIRRLLGSSTITRVGHAKQLEHKVRRAGNGPFAVAHASAAPGGHGAARLSPPSTLL